MLVTPDMLVAQQLPVSNTAQTGRHEYMCILALQSSPVMQASQHNRLGCSAIQVHMLLVVETIQLYALD